MPPAKRERTKPGPKKLLSRAELEVVRSGFMMFHGKRSYVKRMNAKHRDVLQNITVDYERLEKTLLVGNGEKIEECRRNYFVVDSKNNLVRDGIGRAIFYYGKLRDVKAAASVGVVKKWDAAVKARLLYNTQTKAPETKVLVLELYFRDGSFGSREIRRETLEQHIPDDVLLKRANPP